MRHGWDIVRTRPLRETRGVALPVFIHNGSFFLDTLDVYADGTIDAWGFLDRALFHKKLAEGWVDPRPTIGASLSVFNLGRGEVAEAHSEATRDDVSRWVDQVITQLNPSGTDLCDMHGSDTELRGKVRHAKLGMADEAPFRRDAQGVERRGATLPVLVPEGGEFRLETWFVFDDGSSRVGPAGELCSLGDVAAQLDRGALVTQAPEEMWLRIPGLGRYRLTDGFWSVDPRERVKEAFDELAQLRGSPGAVRLCREAFKAYEAAPTNEARERLRAAYEAVPEHNRMYCGDMDSKDWPIRRVLFPERFSDDEDADEPAPLSNGVDE